MSSQLNKSVDFGPTQAGLLTVEYRLYNPDGTPNGSAVTAGITEVYPGAYTALVTAPTGFKGLIVWNTGGVSPKYASDEINTVDAALDPLLNDSPGDYPVGTAGWRIGLLGTAQAAIRSYVAPGGRIGISIGYDQVIDFVDTNNVWPDLTGATVKLITTLMIGNTPFRPAMTVVTATGSNKTVRLTLAAADTLGLTANKSSEYYDVEATWSGGADEALVKGGRLSIVPKPGA